MRIKQGKPPSPEDIEMFCTPFGMTKDDITRTLTIYDGMTKDEILDFLVANMMEAADRGNTAMHITDLAIILIALKCAPDGPSAITYEETEARILRGSSEQTSEQASLTKMTFEEVEGYLRDRSDTHTNQTFVITTKDQIGVDALTAALRGKGANVIHVARED